MHIALLPLFIVPSHAGTRCCRCTCHPGTASCLGYGVSTFVPFLQIEIFAFVDWSTPSKQDGLPGLGSVVIRSPPIWARKRLPITIETEASKPPSPGSSSSKYPTPHPGLTWMSQEVSRWLVLVCGL